MTRRRRRSGSDRSGPRRGPATPAPPRACQSFSGVSTGPVMTTAAAPTTDSNSRGGNSGLESLHRTSLLDVQCLASCDVRRRVDQTDCPQAITPGQLVRQCAAQRAGTEDRNDRHLCKGPRNKSFASWAADASHPGGVLVGRTRPYAPSSCSPAGRSTPETGSASCADPETLRPPP